MPHNWRKSVIIPSYYSWGLLEKTNDTNRAFVFAATETNVTFVTRPPDSEIFSKERIILANSKLEIHDITSAVTKKNSDVIIHLAIRSESNVYYMQGRKNGAEWSSARILSSIYAHDAQAFRISLISNPYITSSLFFVYIPSDLFNISMIWSTSHGDSWSHSEMLLSHPSYFSPTGILCGSADKPRIVVKDYNGNYTSSTSWTESKIIIEKGWAPIDEYSYPIFACQSENPGLIQALGDISRAKLVITKEYI